MQGLPRVALEVGAELPELSQVADVVDLVPTFRVAAGGSLVEAQVSLRAAYEDVEIDVRADGMTAPVIVKPPEPGSGKRARCIRCDIAAQQLAAARLRELGLVPAEDGNKFVARGDDAIQFWTEGIGHAPRRLGPLRPRRSRRRAGPRRGAQRQRARVAAASTGSRCA